VKPPNKSIKMLSAWQLKSFIELFNLLSNLVNKMFTSLSYCY